MNKNTDAKRIATETHDAYSRSRYTDAGWLGIAKVLLAEGATPAEAKWVLESKYMRRAADAANRSHSTTTANFLEYANSKQIGGLGNLIRRAQRVLETTPGSEMLADLIELARQVANGQALNPVGAQRLTERAKKLVAEIEGRAK